MHPHEVPTNGITITVALTTCLGRALSLTAPAVLSASLSLIHIKRGRWCSASQLKGSICVLSKKSSLPDSRERWSECLSVRSSRPPPAIGYLQDITDLLPTNCRSRTMLLHIVRPLRTNFAKGRFSIFYNRAPVPGNMRACHYCRDHIPLCP